MPKASILIPAYNASAYIAATLESILNQSLADFECLVIDDGSTDNTAEIVASYQDSRIQLIRQSNSGGPAAPRNQGLIRATGQYIFMFDADDIMLPEKLQVSVATLDSFPQANLLFTNFQSIDGAGELLTHNYLDEYDTLWNLIPERNSDAYFLNSDELFNALIRVNFIGTSSVAIRKAAIGEEFRFNQTMKNADDYLFWVEFIRKHGAIFLNQILHQYRIIETGISRQDFTKRAPSKIKGLRCIRDLCKNVDQRKVVDKQIADDYAAMSYAYRKKGEYVNSFRSAIRSISWELNKKTLRALVASLIAPIVR